MVFGDEILFKNTKEVFKSLNEKEIKVVISDQKTPEIIRLDLCERIHEIYIRNTKK